MDDIDEAISMLQSMILNTEQMLLIFTRKLEDIAGSTAINSESMPSIRELNEEIKGLVQKVEKLSHRSKFSEGIAFDVFEDKTRDKAKELVSSSSSSSSSLAPQNQSRQTLQVSGVENLEAFFGNEMALGNVFSCLKELDIFQCQKMKVALNIGLLSNLKNLEKLSISSCTELEEIIGEGFDDDDDPNGATTCIILQNLKHLRLFHLPNLRSICPSSRQWVFESLQRIKVNSCQNLKQLSVYVPSEKTGQSSSLRRIELKSKRRKTWKLNWIREGYH